MSKRDDMVREAMRVSGGPTFGPGSILDQRRVAVAQALDRHEAERHDDGEPVRECAVCPPVDGGCIG